MTNKHLKQKLHFLLLALLLLPATLQAQELSVKSFTEKSNDLSASTQPCVDNNGVPCALVKVQIASQGVEFEGMIVGDVAYKTSEYWVFMPGGSKRLTVKLEGYLPLNVEFGNYGINSLESKLTYQLVISGVVANGQQQEVRTLTGWIMIESNPSGASVYINNEYAGNTPNFAKKYEYGNYSYRLEHPKYHPSEGTISLNSGKTEKSVTLRPAFGNISVSSNVNGAQVLLDGSTTGQTTPCTLREVPSGQHTVAVQKEKYAPQQQTVTVRDGETAQASMSLDARFARVSISSLSGASILIDGKRKGSTSYSEELMEGYYDLEVRLEHHKPATKQILVSAGVPQNITLNPTPIYGSLDVVSSPLRANITIDGKSYGTTPNTIDHLLEGEHSVTLSMEGYASETRNVTIRENQSSEVNVTLQNGKELTFTTTPSGAELYVDGKRSGTTPATLNLTYGSHSVKVKNSEAEETDNIQVTATMSQTRFSYDLNATEQTFTVKGVSFTMVKVQGGTFTMGATSEQGGDAYGDEKPAHQVTLSSYSIGQTEVTQALWKAVMGSNPSNFKGDNLPVEQVSLKDCQEFIRKLNQLTGKNFRLPTEAEWEYAARGGSKSRGYKYSGSNNIDNVAWYSSNSNSKTHPVKGKYPNELGLYDMSGNVYEWCSDLYGSYGSSSQTNPTGSNSGSYRVNRGGSWSFNAWDCRVSYRNYCTPSIRFYGIGFRLALSE